MDDRAVAAAASLREALQHVARGLVEREMLVELIALAAVAGEHALVIGPPGTAKSEAVRRFSRATGGRYFEYLLGRFTEPSEIFGPVDLRRLREGVVETETRGMLPEAEVAFLDEVFHGSTAILNTLLGILNERVFKRGHTEVRCPLRVCVGASNALPSDESLAAFADRFLVRAFVEPIGDPQLDELLESGWALERQAPPPTARLEDLDALTRAARDAEMTGVRPHLAHAVRRLRKAGVTLSDRRVVKSQRLVAAAGALAGRSAPTEADLWPLVYVVPTREEQAVARECLRDLLQAAQNPTLAAAAEGASSSRASRAERLARVGRELLGARPVDGDPRARDAWRLRLEGLAREIDAGFAPEDMPADVASVRAEIVRAVQAASA
ncbi:MAG: AAA family ATPase [Myxococcota bacterium]